MVRKAFWLCLLFPFLSDATELLPWLGRPYELDFRGNLLYQSYPSIAGEHHRCRRHGDDLFFNVEAIGYCEGYSFELETTLANTRRQRPALDNVRVTARAQLTNDIVGDFLTITPGITLTQAFRHSVHDVSSFHHGKLAGEFHLALGKEFPCADFWHSRAWAVLGAATADTGSPWFRGDLYWERNWWDRHQLRLFVHSLWGLGKRGINIRDFDGYGPLRHRSVDLGVRYSFLFESGVLLGVEYGRRVYARNFPEKANLFLVSLCYVYNVTPLKQITDLFKRTKDIEDQRDISDL